MTLQKAYETVKSRVNGDLSVIVEHGYLRSIKMTEPDKILIVYDDEDRLCYLKSLFSDIDFPIEYRHVDCWQP